MLQRRRDLLVVIAILMAGSTCLQELTRGLVVNAMVPTLFVAVAVALGLQALKMTFEVRDQRYVAVQLER